MVFDWMSIGLNDARGEMSVIEKKDRRLASVRRMDLEILSDQLLFFMIDEKR
jgi:hypothetical protein